MFRIMGQIITYIYIFIHLFIYLFIYSVIHLYMFMDVLIPRKTKQEFAKQGPMFGHASCFQLSASATQISLTQALKPSRYAASTCEGGPI